MAEKDEFGFFWGIFGLLIGGIFLYIFIKLLFVPNWYTDVGTIIMVVISFLVLSMFYMPYEAFIKKIEPEVEVGIPKEQVQKKTENKKEIKSTNETIPKQKIYKHEDLISAIRENNTGRVKLILKDGRVNPSDNDNKAIELALENEYTEIIQLLLEDSRVDPSDIVMRLFN